MNMTVTMNEAGCIELPRRVRSRFQLKGRTRLELNVTGDSITLRPKRSPDAASGAARLIQKGKLLVATGFPPGVDIAAAIEADRADRDAELAAPFLRRRTPRP